ncbi:hypothetical protein ABZ671_31905 [Micromonospora sp. NPDC006766]|uniref:hypothetical protein n=1 Tax=Micromonospora sp. NPDC006766 TaxID=3154778 RepID=UPI0033CE289B
MDGRRKVIVAGLGVFAAELITGVWYPVLVYVACLASMFILVGAAATLGVRRNRRPWATLLVDERDRSFRTPVYANNLLFGLAVLQLAGFCLVGIHETGAGLVAGLLFTGMLALTWRALWRGAGLTLRPSGIEAGKVAGALIIPWEALAPERPVRGDNPLLLKLSYARPELVTMTGWTPVRDEVVFEDGDPDLVARAIATYAAEPGRRHAIGTLAELERLAAGIPVRRRGWIRESVEPAPTRTTVRRVIMGLLLFGGSVAVANVADRQSWANLLGGLIGATGMGQLYWAVAGWRAARRARCGATGPA